MGRTVTLSTMLRALGACSEAVAWAKPYATLQAAWDECQRPDWMLWLCEHTSTHRDESVRLAFAFADRAVRVDAVAALRSAGLGVEADRLAALPTIDSRAAAEAASDAAWAASNAAWAARDAAGAASAAAWAASVAAGAARAAAGAASDAAGAASAAENANLIRREIPSVDTILAAFAARKEPANG